MILCYVLLAVFLVGAGAVLVLKLRATRQRKVDPRLAVTWQTMQAAARLDAAFWAARQATRREANRHF
jgi:hypothetical protein